MSLSLYQASVPVYVRQLNGLSTILHKAIDYCSERKIEPAVLLHDRFYPDMFTLVRQVQIACGHAERGSSRQPATSCDIRRRHGIEFLETTGVESG